MKSLKAHISSVSPSSERFEELRVCVGLYADNGVRYWWEYGDEKTRIN